MSLTDDCDVDAVIELPQTGDEGNNGGPPPTDVCSQRVAEFERYDLKMRLLALAMVLMRCEFDRLQHMVYLCGLPPVAVRLVVVWLRLMWTNGKRPGVRDAHDEASGHATDERGEGNSISADQNIPIYRLKVPKTKPGQYAQMTFMEAIARVMQFATAENALYRRSIIIVEGVQRMAYATRFVQALGQMDFGLASVIAIFTDDVAVRPTGCSATVSRLVADLSRARLKDLTDAVRAARTEAHLQVSRIEAAINPRVNEFNNVVIRHRWGYFLPEDERAIVPCVLEPLLVGCIRPRPAFEAIARAADGSISALEAFGLVLRFLVRDLEDAMPHDLQNPTGANTNGVTGPSGQACNTAPHANRQVKKRRLAVAVRHEFSPDRFAKRMKFYALLMKAGSPERPVRGSMRRGLDTHWTCFWECIALF